MNVEKVNNVLRDLLGSKIFDVKVEKELAKLKGVGFDEYIANARQLVGLNNLNHNLISRAKEIIFENKETFAELSKKTSKIDQENAAAAKAHESLNNNERKLKNQ